MEMKQIQERIEEYECGGDYSPLKISFKIRPPLFITHPWLYFDSLVQYLCLREALGELFYILPSDEVVSVENLQIPIKQTGDVYHASVSQFDQAPLYQSTIYKRFNDMSTDKLKPRQRMGKIKTNQGYFKDFMINLPFITPRQVTFYSCADKKELERLLPYLSSLGKKGVIGGGKILSMTVEDVESDYSFFRDGKIMRPIPHDIARTIPLMEGSSFMNTTYKPPYWDKRNVKMCLVPEKQITVGV